MPLLPTALPPKGEARRFDAYHFLNLTALPERAEVGLELFPSATPYLASLEMTIRESNVS